MPLSEEYRVFIYAGRIVAIDDYWQENTEIKLSGEEYKWVESIAGRVKSNFVTVDLARKEDGSLIIMEFGDGQVSGLQQLKADAFYRALKGLDIHNPYTIEFALNVTGIKLRTSGVSWIWRIRTKLSKRIERRQNKNRTCECTNEAQALIV